MQIPKPDEYREVHYYTADGMCDSIIYTYSVYIHPTYDSIMEVTMCSNESYKIHNTYTYQPEIAYYEPGSILGMVDIMVADTLQTTTCAECEEGGCDSIFTALVHILPAYKHTDSVTICSDEIYHWRGRDINEALAGKYYYADTLQTLVTQCDSIYDLYLTVHQAYNLDVYDSICADEYYNFGAKALNQTGVYLDTLRTMYNCDSIVTLYLTVHDTTVLQIYDTICVTEKYDFYGTYLTEPGDYDTITLNDWGCKQYNYLHLEVIDTTVYNIAIGDVLCADDEEIWVEYEWLSGRRLIEYSVFFDDYGHSQGFEDIIHAPLNPALNYFVIPIPRGEDLPKPNRPYFDSQQGMNKYVDETKQNYPEPNIYTMRVVMHNGICGDSLQVKDTTISFYYPSWIHEQHWNDGIVLYNEIYNGGYEFSEYQWYENGDTIYGATKEYLYIPSELLINSRGDCENYYQVELTRRSDGYKTMTCPICPVLLFDSIVPQKDYFAIVPTVVDRRNPIVHVLSTRSGKYSYTIHTYEGQTLKYGSFIPDEKNYGGVIDLSGISTDKINYGGTIDLSGITKEAVLIKLTIDDGSSRTFRVIIK
jgi:hypothetical protein